MAKADFTVLRQEKRGSKWTTISKETRLLDDDLSYWSKGPGIRIETHMTSRGRKIWKYTDTRGDGKQRFVYGRSQYL